MFLVREARPDDLEQLLALGIALDSINLPTEREAMERAVECSIRSFRGQVSDRSQATYVFCAEDLERKVLAGASMIIGKHGTPDAPHYYMQMETEERYSRTLRKMFRHTYLQLRWSMDGPTEVGGLIVAPAYRGHPERIGKALSWVRFLYIGKHLERFEPQLIAEIMPPMTPEGSNLFWDHYGRRVTGLSFKEADRLSTRDKEFIRALFPEAPLYTFLLPEDVRASLAAVNERARPAVELLKRAGFRFLNQIDPFDGGPYFGAVTREIVPVKNLLSRRVKPLATPKETVQRYLVACEDAEHGFRAVATCAELTPTDVAIPSEAIEALMATAHQTVDVVPLP